MDEKGVLFWVLGGLLTLISSIGGWVFKRIFEKLQEVEDRQSRHETNMKLELSEIQKELAINSERDVNSYENMMMALANLKEGQDKLFKQMEVWNKNIENFYYLNPHLKKPDLPQQPNL